jgi:hypothetical protein
MGTRTADAREQTVTATVSPEDFRAALERALEGADADERIGPLIASTRLRMRFEFTDSGLALNIAAGGAGDRNLRWSFGEADWSPKLELKMDTETANRFLQGRESLAIAIARGRARAHGESGVALLALPATRLLCESYREVVQSEFPGLVR